MSENKAVNYNAYPKQDKIFIIEEKILNYKNGPEVIGYKIRTPDCDIWMQKDQFNALFEK